MHEALAVYCPDCGAEPGVVCDVKPTLKRAVHLERQKFLQDLQERGERIGPRYPRIVVPLRPRERKRDFVVRAMRIMRAEQVADPVCEAFYQTAVQCETVQDAWKITGRYVTLRRASVLVN